VDEIFGIPSTSPAIPLTTPQRRILVSRGSPGWLAHYLKLTSTDLRKQEIRISRNTGISIEDFIGYRFNTRFIVVMMREVRAIMSSQSSQPVATAGITNLLLTGVPGCGKTTLLERVAEHLGDLRLAGFLSLELREHGQRVGFEAAGLGGRRAILAHVRFGSPVLVGRYGVEADRLLPLIEEELLRPPGTVDAYLIDEIGKMECHCRHFVATMKSLLAEPIPVAATVALRGGGFIAEIKQRHDVQIVEVTPANRQSLPEQIATWIKQRRTQPNTPLR
jgi:nucleoside-triphosphatase